MTVNFNNVGSNSQLISSLLYQIYYMGRYKDTGEDKVISDSIIPPDPDDPSEKESSFDLSFDNSFAV